MPYKISMISIMWPMISFPFFLKSFLITNYEISETMYFTRLENELFEAKKSVF